MPEFVVKILAEEALTHDVKRFVVERPSGYTFIPGQATEVSINQPQWKDEKRPFTFTGLRDAEHLEFVIKIYRDHNVVTDALGQLKVDDELIVRDVWGAIQFKGRVTFFAGGAGITPFIAILRDLQQAGKIAGNKLIFSNKTTRDIILRAELEKILGNDFNNTLTRQMVAGIHHGRIDKAYLKKVVVDFEQQFYVCGPEDFVNAVQETLAGLGAKVDSVVIEK